MAAAGMGGAGRRVAARAGAGAGAPARGGPPGRSAPPGIAGRSSPEPRAPDAGPRGRRHAPAGARPCSCLRQPPGSLHSRAVPEGRAPALGGLQGSNARPLSGPRVRHLQPAPAAPLPLAARLGNSRRPSSAAKSRAEPAGRKGSEPGLAPSRELWSAEVGGRAQGRWGVQFSQPWQILVSA